MQVIYDNIFPVNVYMYLAKKYKYNKWPKILPY